MAFIRRFRKIDLEKVHAIAEMSLKEKYTKELYISIHQMWQDGFLVAELDHTVVGFICGIVEDRDTSRILMLAVHLFYRAQGIGSELLQTFIEKSSNRGLNKVTLEVRVSRDYAIKFYQKRGFQVVGSLKDFYTDGEDGYKMIRYL